ncbi:PDR/VanB family oxidoreductase [Paraherbaspirillum soli]|uniref:PDR/VanB family oxidoreductase n=1 Tax=Paraherbaspirillum soli TaxID=631222 RepID=A0ABW0M738_9BURK
MTQSMLTVVVKKKTTVAQGICAIELVDPAHNNLPIFTAGSHIDVHISDGLVRQYSLCNSPEERHRYLLGILRDERSRGGSQAIHDRVREGDLITISKPKNLFALAENTSKALLFAGGIGITPILSMAEQLALSRTDFEMHYCTRSRNRTAFLDRISNSDFSHQVHCHFDDESPEQYIDLEHTLRSPQPGVHVYVCGPKPFIDAVMNTAKRQGWDAANLHTEYFSAEIAAGSSADAGFEIQIASTGKIYAVAANETIVTALGKHGIAIATSCEQGICGTCLTTVVDGIPDHRDQFLTEQERCANNQVIACCSRAKSKLLVLDL